MSDVKTAIMDAAERRMQRGGFGGFSFREIAADVGIKSSSVHYHFPTKEGLAAAVIRRWAEETSKAIDEQLAKGCAGTVAGAIGPQHGSGTQITPGCWSARRGRRSIQRRPARAISPLRD